MSDKMKKALWIVVSFVFVCWNSIVVFEKSGLWALITIHVAAIALWYFLNKGVGRD